MQVEELIVQSILTRQTEHSAIYPIWDYTINPYKKGCGMGCKFCYVKAYPQMEGRMEMDEYVGVALNAPILIRQNRHKLYQARIFFSSATDPYQYLEKKYQITRKCLKELLWCQVKRLTLHTRSHLILRDLDIIKQFGNRAEVGISIPTNREDIRRRYEGRAPTIQKRYRTVKRLIEEGLKVHVSIAPLLPHDTERFIRELKALGVRRIWVDGISRSWLIKQVATPEEWKWFHSRVYQQALTEISQAFQEGVLLR